VARAGRRYVLHNFKHELHGGDDGINKKCMAQTLRYCTDVHQIPTFNLGAQERLKKGSVVKK
jgi:hypothetical protein